MALPRPGGLGYDSGLLNVLRSSSGLGHRPLTAKIVGSNPIRSTKSLLKPLHSFGPNLSFLGSLVIHCMKVYLAFAQIPNITLLVGLLANKHLHQFPVSAVIKSPTVVFTR